MVFWKDTFLKEKIIKIIIIKCSIQFGKLTQWVLVMLGMHPSQGKGQCDSADPAWSTFNTACHSNLSSSHLLCLCCFRWCRMSETFMIEMRHLWQGRPRVSSWCSQKSERKTWDLWGAIRHLGITKGLFWCEQNNFHLKLGFTKVMIWPGYWSCVVLRTGVSSGGDEVSAE